MKNNEAKSAAHNLFVKYYYLVEQYSKGVFSHERASLDQEDIRQELSIKLFNAIKAYGRKLAEYKRTGKRKPIDIEYYLRRSLYNCKKDIFKNISSQMTFNSIEVNPTGIFEDNEISICDPGCHDSRFNDYNIGDFDLLVFTKSEQQKACLKLYLKGYPISRLNKIFNFDVSKFINDQTSKLKHCENDIYQELSLIQI